MASPAGLEGFTGEANRLLRNRLDARLRVIERHMGADALAFTGPLVARADDIVREAIERRSASVQRSGGERPDKLIVILETFGGHVEIAERMADTFRHHYARVEFVIPNHAFSAGTILAMSGDAIHMDYYSVLGPIDPQVLKPAGAKFVPALGYLTWYRRMIRKSELGRLSGAELTFLFEKFDPAELYSYEQQRNLSITLLERWLTNYKFKDWRETEQRKIPVDEQMRRQRAREIAIELSRVSRWHSHGRGLSMRVLRDELNLHIDDFGEDAILNASIKQYHRLIRDYIARESLADIGVVHMVGCLTPLIHGR